MEEEVAFKVELLMESEVRLEQKAFCQAGTLHFLLPTLGTMGLEGRAG